MNLVLKFMHWLRSILKHKHNSILPSTSSIQIPPFLTINDHEIACVIVTHFYDFIPYATKHYNAMLKLIEPYNPYHARYESNDMIRLAVDYFKRNRSRLFQWWCMHNKNALSSNAEFNVLVDLYGFNDAFKILCKKMFFVDIDPDMNYNYGINAINDDGSTNAMICSMIN